MRNELIGEEIKIINGIYSGFFGIIVGLDKRSAIIRINQEYFDIEFDVIKIGLKNLKRVVRKEIIKLEKL